MRELTNRLYRYVGVLFILSLFLRDQALYAQSSELWKLALSERENLKIATLFTARNVADFLSSQKGREEAYRWCKENGVTHVFIESFRSAFQVPESVLKAARDYFTSLGFQVSGCVTTTRFGKASTGWKIICCLSDAATRKNLSKIFSFTARLFDTIMIDDFLFTDCTCSNCTALKGNRSWSSFRRSLMFQVSKENILSPARRANPKVKVIIKYPQWYDNFHNRGYDVVAQTRIFDRIWVGTETRDPDSVRWGRKAQYEAYFIMRWLSRIGGRKTGGGWFDPYGTSPPTYVEQARQTVLAGAREMLLFCYGSLREKRHARNLPALRKELPQLFKLSRWVHNQEPVGIPAVKPPNSQSAPGEEYLFDWIGMLGFPLDPRPNLPKHAPSVLLTSHFFSKPNWRELLRPYIRRKAVFLVSPFAEKKVRELSKDAKVCTLRWKGDVRNLMKLPTAEINRIRDKVLSPMGIRFEAPTKVALYLIGKKVIAFENFRDQSVSFRFKSKMDLRTEDKLLFPPEADSRFEIKGAGLKGVLAPRSLLVLKLRR